MKILDRTCSIIRKINGDLNDKKWDENEGKYIKKDALFLAPSTKAFVTIINVIQIVTKGITLFFGVNVNSIITIVICTVSIFLMYFKIENKVSTGSEVSIAPIREVVSYILFWISIILIFF